MGELVDEWTGGWADRVNMYLILIDSSLFLLYLAGDTLG